MNLGSAVTQRNNPLTDSSDQILSTLASVGPDISDMYEFPNYVVDFATLCSHFTRLVDDGVGGEMHVRRVQYSKRRARQTYDLAHANNATSAAWLCDSGANVVVTDPSDPAVVSITADTSRSLGTAGGARKAKCARIQTPFGTVSGLVCEGSPRIIPWAMVLVCGYKVDFIDPRTAHLVSKRTGLSTRLVVTSGCPVLPDRDIAGVFRSLGESCTHASAGCVSDDQTTNDAASPVVAPVSGGDTGLETHSDRSLLEATPLMSGQESGPGPGLDSDCSLLQTATSLLSGRESGPGQQLSPQITSGPTMTAGRQTTISSPSSPPGYVRYDDSTSAYEDSVSSGFDCSSSDTEYSRENDIHYGRSTRRRHRERVVLLVTSPDVSHAVAMRQHVASAELTGYWELPTRKFDPSNESAAGVARDLLAAISPPDCGHVCAGGVSSIGAFARNHYFAVTMGAKDAVGDEPRYHKPYGYVWKAWDALPSICMPSVTAVVQQDIRPFLGWPPAALSERVNFVQLETRAAKRNRAARRAARRDRRDARRAAQAARVICWSRDNYVFTTQTFSRDGRTTLVQPYIATAPQLAAVADRPRRRRPRSRARRTPMEQAKIILDVDAHRLTHVPPDPVNCPACREGRQVMADRWEPRSRERLVEHGKHTIVADFHGKIGPMSSRGNQWGLVLRLIRNPALCATPDNTVSPTAEQLNVPPTDGASMPVPAAGADAASAPATVGGNPPVDHAHAAEADDKRDPFYIGVLPDREDESFIDILHAARVEWGIENDPFVFRGDMERAFVSAHARRYLAMHNSFFRFSVPYRKDTAALAESAVRVANEGLRTTLHASGIPLSYWDYAWQTWFVNYNAVHCGQYPRINTVPQRHMIPFGQLGHCVLPHAVYRPEKPEARGTPVFFLGYALDTAGGIRIGFYDSHKQTLRKTIVLERDVIWTNKYAFSLDLVDFQQRRRFADCLVYGAQPRKRGRPPKNPPPPALVPVVDPDVAREPGDHDVPHHDFQDFGRTARDVEQSDTMPDLQADSSDSDSACDSDSDVGSWDSTLDDIAASLDPEHFDYCRWAERLATQGFRASAAQAGVPVSPSDRTVHVQAIPGYDSHVQQYYCARSVTIASAVGLDLPVAARVVVPPKSMHMVPLGVRVAVVQERADTYVRQPSSTSATFTPCSERCDWRLETHFGNTPLVAPHATTTIPADFGDELRIPIYNTSTEPFVIEKGSCYFSAVAGDLSPLAVSVHTGILETGKRSTTAKHASPSPSATEIAVFDARRAFDHWGQSVQPQAEYNAHGLPEFPAYVARLEVSRTDIFHKLQQENLVAHDEAAVDGIFYDHIVADLQAHVTKLLTGSEKKSPDAVAARQDEVRKVCGFDTFAEPVTYEDAKKDPGATVSGVYLISSIKHFEREPSAWKHKGRLVLMGNQIYSLLTGKPIFPSGEDLGLFGAVTSLEGFRSVLTHAAVHDYDLESADLTNAYLHASWPEGTPSHYVWGTPEFLDALPDALREKTARILASGKTPAFRLKRCLYGHPLSGHIFIESLLRHLRARGWTELPGVPAVMRRGSCLVCVYVDDLCAAGPQAELAALWDEIRARFPIGTVGPCSEFLGMQISRSRDEKFRYISVDMQDYTRQVVATFKELFTPSDWSEPRRQNYPYHKDTPLPEKTAEDHASAPSTPEKRVQKLIGMLLWLSRCGRPDIAYALSRLGSQVSRWSDRQTAALAHCVGYLRRGLDRESVTLKFRVHVDDTPADLRYVLYTDSNLDVPRSQSGFAYNIESARGTHCPVHWGSRKQSVCCDSVAAAELVASHLGIREVLMLHEGLCGCLGNAGAVLDVCVDNSTVVRVARKGTSANLDWLESRVLRLRLGFLRDLIELNALRVSHVSTDLNKADIHTKRFDRIAWLRVFASTGLSTTTRSSTMPPSDLPPTLNTVDAHNVGDKQRVV